MASEIFPYGASYSPLIFDESQWDKDLAWMQQAGMNLVRLGDCHASWDRIEPEEGRYAFERLGLFYRAADRYGIQVILSTGASSPPLWLARKHPDLPLLSNADQHYPLGASYHWACISHPAYQTALQNYIHALLDFTAQHSNHFGWQITNEIGFPFMPAFEDGNLGLYCYCEHCSAKFRQWAEEKYQTLESLSHAWSWSTTNYVYNAWADVFPPRSMPNAWAGVSKWIDWRLFWQEAFANFAGWQHRLIREEDVHHPTSVNTFNFKGYDRFGTLMGLDQWQIAKQIDHIGYDLYPGSGNKLASRPEHISIFLDHGRSVSQSVGRDFWLHEIESGPIGGWVMGPEFNTRAEDVTNYVIEALGHDAKLILFMPWREWDYQPLRWGALVDLDGSPTPRYDAARQLGTFISENADFLMHAHVLQSEIAILESKANAIFFRGIGEEEKLFTAQRGAYRAFWEAGYGVDFITPEQIASGDCKKYRVIVLPMVGLMDTHTAEQLADYVQAGGILLGFARCGTLDGRGWYHHQLPISGLQKAFGILRVEADRLDAPAIQYAGQVYAGWWNRDLVTPAEGTQVLASFEDQKPALTLAAYGKGHGIYLATQADAGHVSQSPSILADVVGRLLPALGLSPRFRIQHDHQTCREVDVHFLKWENRRWILLSNLLKKPGHVKLSLQWHGTQAVQVQKIWPHRGPLDCTWQPDELSLSFNLVAEEVMVIEMVVNVPQQ